MNGYGSQTSQCINKKNETGWVKFHFKTQQGNKTLTGPQANELSGKDPDYSQRDLVDAINQEGFPEVDP